MVPIDMKITKSQLNVKSLTTIMENFLDDFDIIIKRLTGVKIQKIRIKIPNPKPYDEAIVLGLPSSLVAQMYGSTHKNIEKRKSQLKKMGIKVLDSRSRVARLARFLTKDEIEDIYSIMVRMLIEEYKRRDSE
jgi:hypothetical protein